MDATRFDNITRRLSSVASRRGVLGAMLAATGALAGSRGAAANGVGRRSVCRPMGAGCTRHAQCCSDQCPTTRTLPRDVRNRCARPVACGDNVCGDDGFGRTCGACSDGATCVSGQCVVPGDCSTYNGDKAPQDFSVCLETPDAGNIYAKYSGIQYVAGDPCAASSECVERLEPEAGRTAYCGRGLMFCGGLSCKPLQIVDPTACILVTTSEML